MLSGGDDHTIKLWDVGSGREVRTFAVASDDPVLAVAFNPDGQTALSGAGDGQVKLWDVSSGRELRTLTEGTAIVEACNAGFGPDGRTAFADDGKGGARLWDFSRAGRYLEFEPRLERARARLRQDRAMARHWAPWGNGGPSAAAANGRSNCSNGPGPAGAKCRR